jgi:hypothetical protein
LDGRIFAVLVNYDQRAASVWKLLMPPQLDIVAIAGSLRAASFNRGLLRAAAELAPADVAVEILDLASLPLYNQDLEDTSLPHALRACGGECVMPTHC